ncbi:GOLPH3/VPS74 family protein [Streptacidiphilus sp. PAMC 29251]
MTLGDDLLLLAIHPRTGRIRVADRIGFGLQAAELLELALFERIELTSGIGRVEVRDTAPVEDRRLNNSLQRLGRTSPAPTLKSWIRETPRGLAQEYLSRLEDQKAVRVDRMAPRRPQVPPAVTLVDRARQGAVRQRVERAARGEVDTDPAARGLASLVHACGLDARLYRGPRGWAIRGRLARLDSGQPLSGTGHGHHHDSAGGHHHGGSGDVGSGHHH